MDDRIEPIEFLDDKGNLIEKVTVSQYLKRVKHISNHSLQVAGGKSKFNPVFTMFLLKNHHDYTDKKEVSHTVGFDLDKLHSKQTAEESQLAPGESKK